MVILGSGNLNDLDLASVRQVAGSIDLVDIDRQATLDGLRRQAMHADPGIRVHETDVRRSADLAEAITGNLSDGPCLVASTTLLTQLVASLPQPNPDSAASVRREHLATVVNLLSPGGTGIIVTDVTSTDTTDMSVVPSLAAIASLVRDGNFFLGANPFAIASELADSEPVISTSVAVTDPWLWDIGDRAYAVIATLFVRHSQP